MNIKNQSTACRVQDRQKKESPQTSQVSPKWAVGGVCLAEGVPGGATNPVLHVPACNTLTVSAVPGGLRVPEYCGLSDRVHAGGRPVALPVL